MAHTPRHYSYTLLSKSSSTDIATAGKSNRKVLSMTRHVVVKSGFVYYKSTKIGFLKVSINYNIV